MRVIELTKGQVAIVDDEDFDALAQYRWNYNAAGYARRTINFRLPDGKFSCSHVMMHHAIIGKPPRGSVVDHCNLNKLDNRRENLRVCTYSQNTANSKLSSRSSTGFKGVTKIKNQPFRPFRAGICVRGKTYILGNFSTAEAAGAAYAKAALEHFGEFARTN